MNASGFILLIFAVFVALASAVPASYVPGPGLFLRVAEEKSTEEPSLVDYEVDEEDFGGKGVRLARATCDLLSFSTKFGSLNHSACAGHCLAMRRGYKGGRCRDGVCHCRR